MHHEEWTENRDSQPRWMRLGVLRFRYGGTSRACRRSFAKGGVGIPRRSPASEEEMSEMSVRRLLPPRYTDAQIEAWRDRHADLGDRYEEAALAELLALRAENERLREALMHARRWASCDADRADYPQSYLTRVAFLDAALSGETAEPRREQLGKRSADHV